MNKQSKCQECGMLVEANEYHPYAACLMFHACRNGKTVQTNLDAVVAHGYQLAIDNEPNLGDKDE